MQVDKYAARAGVTYLSPFTDQSKAYAAPSSSTTFLQVEPRRHPSPSEALPMKSCTFLETVNSRLFLNSTFLERHCMCGAAGPSEVLPLKCSTFLDASAQRTSKTSESKRSAVVEELHLPGRFCAESLEDTRVQAKYCR